MKINGRILALAALFTLSACQQGAKPDNQANATQDIENDRCGASQYQSYVGKPLTVLNSVRFAGPVRAIPYNSAVTMDFNLNRLNFLGDSKGNITSAYCG